MPPPWEAIEVIAMKRLGLQPSELDAVDVERLITWLSVDAAIENAKNPQ